MRDNYLIVRADTISKLDQQVNKFMEWTDGERYYPIGGVSVFWGVTAIMFMQAMTLQISSLKSNG